MLNDEQLDSAVYPVLKIKVGKQLLESLRTDEFFVLTDADRSDQIRLHHSIIPRLVDYDIIVVVDDVVLPGENWELVLPYLE